MKYTGAEIIIHMLEKKGIETIAGIPGGANLPLYNALSDSKIRHVLARHEQGAGFIAQGMARSTGKAAVCFATSGPGVLKPLVFGIDLFGADRITLSRHIGHGVRMKGRKVTERWWELVSQGANRVGQVRKSMVLSSERIVVERRSVSQRHSD